MLLLDYGSVAIRSFIYVLTVVQNPRQIFRMLQPAPNATTCTHISYCTIFPMLAHCATIHLKYCIEIVNFVTKHSIEQIYI